MKIKLLIIILLLFVAVILLLGILLHTRKIWFVYPNKNIYAVDGLDISHHQGIIDWENVEEKYQFVFIKATEGDDFIDNRFYENAKNIKNTNRILGAYHFFHFNYDGVEQADNFINTVGDIIDLPPVVDFEFTGNPNTFGKDRMELIDELNKCINRLEEYYGHKVIIYTTKDAYKYIIKDNFDNPLWYRSIILPINNRKINNVVFWQYHNSATIQGINTIVDLNVFKGDIIELKKLIME
jgi:lysozyme